MYQANERVIAAMSPLFPFEVNGKLKDFMICIFHVGEIFNMSFTVTENGYTIKDVLLEAPSLENLRKGIEKITQYFGVGEIKVFWFSECASEQQVDEQSSFFEEWMLKNRI